MGCCSTNRRGEPEERGPFRLRACRRDLHETGGGGVFEAFERGKSLAEIYERLDRIERALVEGGRLTPEIAAELRAIRAHLGAAT